MSDSAGVATKSSVGPAIGVATASISPPTTAQHAPGMEPEQTGRLAPGRPPRPYWCARARSARADPDREPGEVRRQPAHWRARRVLGEPLADPQVPGDADRDHRDQEQAEARRPEAMHATPEDEHGQRGQHEVEGDLDGEAPHLGQALRAPRRPGSCPACSKVRSHSPRPAPCVLRDEGQGEDHGDDVHGIDPQEPLPVVAPGPRSGPLGGRGDEVRPRTAGSRTARRRSPRRRRAGPGADPRSPGCCRHRTGSSCEW